MRILITGNMGYVGPEVVAALRAAYPQAELIGVDAGFFAHCLTGADELPERRLNRQHFVDVRSVPASLLEGVDTVIHLAAVSNDPMGNAYEAVTAQINYEASVRLAKLAKAAGVKAFVFASSCSVYGYAEGEARDEGSELNPLTAYARSKINTEQEVAPLAGEGFSVTCLRFPTACGMSPRVRLDLVLNDFVAGAVASGKIAILSDGTPWRPLIDIKDMARAITWAVDRQPEQGGPFLAINVGRSEWNYQVKQLAEAVAEVVPGVEVEINESAPPDKRSYRVDFSLYKRLAPDHLPRIDLRQSISELREGLAHAGFSDPDFRNSRYMRLKVLGALRESGALSDQLRWC